MTWSCRFSWGLGDVPCPSSWGPWNCGACDPHRQVCLAGSWHGPRLCGNGTRTVLSLGDALWNDTRNMKGRAKLSLFPVKIPLYREDSDTTVLSPSVTNSVSSHCITLILLGQTINLLGESQTQENLVGWGLFTHQPPIGLQYSTICSTNNTIPRTRLTCIRLHLDRPRLHTPCLHASSP